MIAIVVVCFVLVLATTFMHYEVLRMLQSGLPALAIPDRWKLVVVILATFVAHALEISLYGFAMYGLVVWGDAGGLTGNAETSLGSFMFFSAETYTSLGFGALTPVGPIRLLVGVEALNGLLLIGWSASFTYLSMERFWSNSP